MAKKLKDMVKKNPVANPTFGTDPSNPWATKYNVTEASETELLARYLNSRGINPNFVPKDTKIAHAKSAEYAKWKADHTERFAREEVEQIDELSPATMAAYILKTSSKDPKRVEPRKKIMSKLAKAMAKQPADPKAPRYSTKMVGEENKLTSLDKFRKASADREKKHAEIEKERQSAAAQGKENMKSAIDRLEKHLNKEETINEVSSSEVEHHFNNWTNSEHAPYNSDAGDDNKVHQSALRYLRSTNVPKEKHEKLAMHIAHKFHGSGIDEASNPGISKTKETLFHKKLDKLVHSTFGKRKDEMKMKEETLNELNYDTVKSLYNKRRDDFHGDQVGKKKKGKEVSAKNVSRSISRLMGYKPTSEDAFQDTYAATQMPFDGANTTNDTSMKREMSKSARIIKSIYKRKNMKEELADWEKEDKSVQTYGKKPKLDMTDKKSNIGENKPEARAVMAGGKTLTGQPRDMVEIDPAMKTRPDQPDTFDKGNPKKSPA